MSRWPYSVLGLEPDAGERDIRRAYARLLKTTHPEDDPAGFQALREAYEAAIDHRPGRMDRDGPSYILPPTPSSFPDAPPAPRAGTVTPVEPGPERPATSVPASPDAREELHAALQTLGRLLQTRPDARDEQLAVLNEIIASPALERVSTQQEAELDLAALIVYNSPASDGLINRTVEAFGWDLQDHRLDLPYNVAAVLERQSVLGHLSVLSHKSSSHFKAWRLIQKPAPRGFLGEWRMGWHAKRMRAFLMKLPQAPGVADAIDDETLEIWSEAVMPGQGAGGFRWTRLAGYAARLTRAMALWVAGFAVAVALMLWGMSGDDASRALRDPGLTCREAARGEEAPNNLACDRALSLTPTPLVVLNDAALVRLRLGDEAGAKAHLDRLLAISPTDARALYQRALARRHLREEAGAAEDAGHALAADPALTAVFRAYGFEPTREWKPTVLAQPPKRLSSVRVRNNQVFEKADWASKPERKAEDEKAFTYALKATTGGRVTVNCRIEESGALAGCIVTSETPQDSGLADAALALAAQARMTPPKLDGKVVGGLHVNVPFSFKP